MHNRETFENQTKFLPPKKQVNYGLLYSYLKHFEVKIKTIANIHNYFPSQVSRGLRTGIDKSLLKKILPTAVKKLNAKGCEVNEDFFLKEVNS